MHSARHLCRLPNRRSAVHVRLISTLAPFEESLMQRSSIFAAVMVVATLASLARAAVIDFETTPAAVAPTDDAFLSAPYNISGGGTVTFFFDANGNLSYDAGIDGRPVFEAYGADTSDGFANGLTSINDTANGGLASQLGSYFLRQLQPGGVPQPFIVDYNTSQVITALSGEIWDIDGAPGNTEGWLVEAARQLECPAYFAAFTAGQFVRAGRPALGVLVLGPAQWIRQAADHVRRQQDHGIGPGLQQFRPHHRRAGAEHAGAGRDRGDGTSGWAAPAKPPANGSHQGINPHSPV